MVEINQSSASEAAMAAVAPQLRGLAADIAAIAAPTEGVFTVIGDALGAAQGVLATLEGDFADVSSRLDSDEAVQAEQTMKVAVGQCGALSANAQATDALLAKVEGIADGSAKPVGLLAKIITEVGALAINAKIQAAQVNEASVDFSVFTTEMGRLHGLAEGAVKQAASRLAALEGALAAARGAEDSFRRDKSGELHDIRARLEGGVAAFAERRARARRAMAATGERSRRVAQRLADCVRQMQINDLTRQRVEHVCAALDLLGPLVDPARGGGADWARALPPARKAALVAAVCRLQAQQLDGAAKDFVREVVKLKDSMDELARDAASTMHDVSALFDGAHAGDSFLSDLQRDADAAARILTAYAAADTRVCDLVGAVSSGFEAMVADMDAIHAIDADMRVMGLNASLKCGRLGTKGRALGVVAQELRACSRRTEEASESISAAIAAAREASGELAARVADEHTHATTLQTAITSSMGALSDLGATLRGAVAGLNGACARVATQLGQTARGIRVHLDLETAAGRAAASLSAIAAAIPADPALAAAVQDDARRLLEKHYTMASERVVHGMIAADAPGRAAAVDAMFF